MAAAIRATRVLKLGQYSRMMDLGGMNPAGGKTSAPIRTVDGARNCKVQLVAFDFNVLTRSVAEKDAAHDNCKVIVNSEDAANGHDKRTSTALSSSPVSVLVDRVQEIAGLLDVNLGDNAKLDRSKSVGEDDLSGLMSESSTNIHEPTTATSIPVAQQRQKRSSSTDDDTNPKNYGIAPFSTDVRAKYADKLRNSRAGGLAGVENAKRQVADALSKGDAAGHLAARAAAVSQTAAEAKWMALTGTGSLLTYISNRSMKIALLPIPAAAPLADNDDAPTSSMRKKMEAFTKQLSLVSFDLLIDKGEDALTVLQNLREEFGTAPVATMIVSDRDDYLRAAKDDGMIACRIRPKNARRGNVSAHYNVETVGDVKNIVDEINGISFQATRAAGQRF